MPELINDGCPFCLANGKMKSLQAETDLGYLAVPINSPVPGAYLIVPKKHLIDDRNLPDLWQVTRRELLGHVPWIDVWHRNDVTNNGSDAGQTILHLHEWVIPRSGELPMSTAYRLSLATLVGKANHEAGLKADRGEWGLD